MTSTLAPAVVFLALVVGVAAGTVTYRFLKWLDQCDMDAAMREQEYEDGP